MKLLLLFCALFVLFNLTIAAPAPKPAVKSARQIDMDDDLPPEDLPPIDGNGGGNGGGNGRPLVTTSKEGGRRNVGVNIPWIYEMGLNTGTGGTDLDINVLSGLVKVKLDRSRDPATGRRKGPISVSVAGVPIFGGPNI